MVAYRFCRPDDMPLICRAVNECYNPHFPGVPPLTVDGLRKEIQEVSVWVSNAMVAREGDEPVGVMVGTKRPEEVLIHRVGVRDDYQRRGHGRHMLTSLSHKLAVLGPPRLIAEVPDDRDDLQAFFEASGYHREIPYTDYLHDPDAAPARTVPEELVIPITLAQVEEQELLTIPPGVAWERTRATLEGRGEALQGWAIATPERVEAFALGRPADPPEETFDILAWGTHDPERRELLLGLLTPYLQTATGRPLRLPRLSQEETAAQDLKALGFRPGPVYHRYASEAVPA